jgi:hypothetical protein
MIATFSHHFHVFYQNGICLLDKVDSCVWNIFLSIVFYIFLCAARVFHRFQMQISDDDDGGICFYGGGGGGIGCVFVFEPCFWFSKTETWKKKKERLR